MAEYPCRFNPFPGLRPFTSDEDYLFFGREDQVKALLRRLRQTRFLAVVGTSGSGKSSLVQAGLLPALHGGLMAQAGSSWRVAVFRPGGDPIGALARALNQPEAFGTADSDEANAALRATLTETTLRRSSLGLVEVVRQARLPTRDNLLVVVDQFEELFRFQDTRKGARGRDDSAAFVKLLLEASRTTTVAIYVVLTMRSDFLGDCAQFRDLPEALNNGQFLIPSMTRDQLRQAIEGPVAVGGAKMTSRLVQRLLNDVGGNADYLPVLQHAMMRTWDRWLEDGSEALDLPHYDATGGMTMALSRHAEEVYAALPDGRSRAVAERVFKALTDKSVDDRGVRRPTRLDGLCGVASATEAEVMTVIETFRQPGCSFLMPLAGMPLNADSVVDISHESLMRVWERLKSWVEEEAQSARMYRRLAETAILHQEGQAGLWRDPDLQLALHWCDQTRPNAAWAARYHSAFEPAMQFLEESRAARQAELARQAAEAERQQDLEKARAVAEERAQRIAVQEKAARRLRWGAVLLAGLVLIAVGAAGFAVKQRWAAERSEQLATERAAESHRLLSVSTAQAMAAQVLRQLDRHKDERNALLARQAYLINQRNQGYAQDQIDDGLRTVLSAPYFSHILRGHEESVLSVAFSPDGQRLASGGGDTTVRLWDLRQPEAAPLTLRGHEGSVLSVVFSPDGRRLASGDGDGTIRIWITRTEILADMVCVKVWRNLTADEWRQFVGADLPYERTCPNQPPGEGAPPEMPATRSLD